FPLRARLLQSVPPWSFLPAFPFSTSVHSFFDGHGRRSGLALVILQPRPLLVLGHGAQTQTDLFIVFLHPNDLEIVLIPDGQRRVPFLRTVRHRRNFGTMAQRLNPWR